MKLTVLNLLQLHVEKQRIYTEKFPTQNETDGIKFIAVTCGKTTCIYTVIFRWFLLSRH